MLVVHFMPKIIVSEILMLQKCYLLFFVNKIQKEQNHYYYQSHTLECELITFIEIETENRKPIHILKLKIESQCRLFLNTKCESYFGNSEISPTEPRDRTEDTL